MPHLTIDWLAEHVAVPAGTTLEQVAADLVRVGLEEERIEGGATVTGPLVVGRVLQLQTETHKNGKAVNYCRVDVGELHNEAATSDFPASRGIVCGAHNFTTDDLVVVALPGAVLPGDFAIAARKTYGHVSDGMICSASELGLPADGEGIIVLEPGHQPGQDAVAVLGLGEPVLEINVTPDRGYCFSMRGIAREYALSTGSTFTDPAQLTPAATSADAYSVTLADHGCDRFATRIVTGIDPQATSPQWMQRRLQQAGMRPVSLIVDVTNYVMLDLGQPLHAYDLGALRGAITVRRARAGESLETLDGVQRELGTADLLITDDDGARVLGLAGVMGGSATEVGDQTTEILLEAAHFDPVAIARTARSHKLPTEASKRFERGVDPQLPPVAAQRAVDLILEFSPSATAAAAGDLDRTLAPPSLSLPVALPGAVVGVDYSPEEVALTLRKLGAEVGDFSEAEERTLVVTVPSWRPDLRSAIDLVEEVVRVDGYDRIPSRPAVRGPGVGLRASQRRRRQVLQWCVEQGLSEVWTYPFVSASIFDQLEYPPQDPRRQAVELSNPLAADAPLLRTSLLQTLVEAAARNLGRGLNDLAIFEVGSVFHPARMKESPLPPPAQRPTDETLAQLAAALPQQPRQLAALWMGDAVQDGPLQTRRSYDYADALEFVAALAQTLGVPVQLFAAQRQPWHPGRAAGIAVAGETIGYAGELAPRVCENLRLPPRSVAVELDLEALLRAAPTEPAQYPRLATFPAAKEDLALLVAEEVPAAEVETVVRAAAGPLLEELRLFDDYRGEAIPNESKSLAFALRLRSPQGTLTSSELATIRERIVGAAAAELGAQLRS